MCCSRRARALLSQGFKMGTPPVWRVQGGMDKHNREKAALSGARGPGPPLAAAPRGPVVPLESSEHSTVQSVPAPDRTAQRGPWPVALSKDRPVASQGNRAGRKGHCRGH